MQDLTVLKKYFIQTRIHWEEIYNSLACNLANNHNTSKTDQESKILPQIQLSKKGIFYFGGLTLEMKQQYPGTYGN